MGNLACASVLAQLSRAIFSSSGSRRTLPEEMVAFLWLAFVLYWVIAARGGPRVKMRQGGGSRAVQIALVWSGYALLWGFVVPFAALRRRFVPHLPAVAIAGVLVTFAGVALAIWARWHLGKFWSSVVTLREGHQLIRSGPYARLRHPIYSGIVLASAGTALVFGEYRCLVAVGLVLLGFAAKARTEDALLAREFGEPYEQYRRQAGFLLPRLL